MIITLLIALVCFLAGWIGGGMYCGREMGLDADIERRISNEFNSQLGTYIRAAHKLHEPE